ncbi:homocysteine S-methyltransferase family protein [Haliea sp. E17]|uniref:homocysteine S-methyltransferase family protein n=1 Tax=Haliea sp. E17 TaxID=3401576 RepID=UPI003AAD5375
MNTRTESLRAQLGDQPLLTDAGLETDLIFNHGIDLPNFASFDLLSTDWGRDALVNYYRRYLDLARDYGTGFILETPTWRASEDWGSQMGYSADDLDGVNRAAVELMQALRQDYADVSPVLVSGNIGPRGDGYAVQTRMTATEARDYHAKQIAAFVAAGADLASAFTLNYIEEAQGIALAAKEAGIPVVLSFTVETDARLPSGEGLEAAVRAVDEISDSYPVYFMINCAHPTHFNPLLREGGAWLQRIRGIRANASRCSHAELDAAEELDAGNPEEFGSDYRELRQLLPGLQVFGGCCGSDYRHVAQIAAACFR